MSQSKEKTLAPVALFVYNRLRNTKEVIEALQKNYLAPKTDLIIYSDGAKTTKQEKPVQAVRDYLKKIDGFKSVTLIERPENFYIERNIMEGVTETVNKYGRIIVLEDDGVTAPHFLTFMNQALDYYEDKKKVMHIATFTFIDMPKDFRKVFFWRYVENTGGGWGTWADRWEKFQYFTNEKDALNSLTDTQKKHLQLDGASKCLELLKLEPITWDICWGMTLARNEGLAVNSPGALTINNGLYNGTHFGPINRLLGKNAFTAELDPNETIIFHDDIKENPEAIKKLKEFYKILGTGWRERTWHIFLRILVFLGITKLLKRLFK